MRIQQVRFKNLNSLVGEWEIDLTQPSFSSNGIFAITGPTGAGKTTILDAICLALYGRTPRLSKVTKSGNEIMSRQTGDCFAEVTFETQAGRYRCHWSQHRSRKKSDGELQPPKHEIADADSGQIFESKLRGVADQIESATGMDFDRFTRSMLLAQGGFAVFLQAAPDERAPILEQITGTEIYSQISVRAHELRSDERKKLDILLAEFAGMQLLSEDDENQLNSSLEQKTLLDADLNRQMAQTSQAITWLDGIACLEQELKLVAEQKQEWQNRHEAFVPENERLKRAINALELAGDHAGLVSIRREQDTDRSNHNECVELLPASAETVKCAEEDMKLAVELLEKRKVEQKKTLLIIKKAREFDLKIQEKVVPLKSTGDAVTDLKNKLTSLRPIQDEDIAALGNNKNKLEDVLKHLATTQADEGLVEQLAGIRGRFDALKDLIAQQNTKSKEIKTAGSQVTETGKIWKELSEKLDTQKLGLENTKGLFTEKQLKLNNTLENLELAEWRNRISALTERTTLLNKLSDTVKSLADSRLSLLDLGKRHDAIVADKSILADQLQTQNESQVHLEREMNLLETQLSLLKKIQDFEEARHQLQDGEHCPLCGAMEHPFAEGNIPLPDETTSALTRVRADLKSSNDKVAGLKVKLAEVNKDLEQVTLRQKECSEKTTKSDALIQQYCETLSIDVSGQDLSERVQSLWKKDADQLDCTTKIVQTADEIVIEITPLRELLEKSKESVVLAEQETQAAAHKMETAGQLLERLKKEAEDLDGQQTKLLGGLQQELTVYGVEKLAIDVLDHVEAELILRRDQWGAKQKEKQELDQQITALELQTRLQAEQINQADAEMKKQQELLTALKVEYDTICFERHELFGDKNPDDEETSLSAAIEKVEKELETCRQTYNTAALEFSNLKIRIDGLDKSMTARVIRLKSAEELFLAKLGGLGFIDESSYVAACLPETDRKSLMQQAQKLSDEQTELASKERDKTMQLDTEKQMQVTDQPRDDLNQVLTSIAGNQKELQQEIGGIRQKLNDNESLKLRQKERAQVIEAQKRECSRWDLLHELIGSADGKKYRNFAQGLTFEMMIGHANRQLQKMSDRYLLIRDNGQPLELNVIDNYQAGEVRSTKNLSGGESFIVSLSLALGLSQMASKNVRVDSLFLDEGFGTLDEEALDTALETLSGLQQDGKLIGVISHVSALKERISLQIEVTPQAGGRSIITGPGCKRV